MMRKMRIVLAVLSVCVMSAVGVQAGSGGYYSAHPMSTTVGMGYVQGTPMYAGCSSCGDACGTCYSGCGSCCPGVLHAVVGGIDHLLKAVLCGHRFCDPCGGAMLCDDCGGGPACGCDAGYEGVIEGGAAPPAGSSDPFIDDAQQPASAPQARQYRLWNMPQPVRYRRAPTPAARATVSSHAAPRRLDVSQAQPLPAVKSAAKVTVVRSVKPTVRATSGDSTDLQLPRNPLRD